MANSSGRLVYADVKRVVAYELDASGNLKATSSSTPYMGVEIDGPQAYDLTVPEPREITFRGGGRVTNQMSLPASEPLKMEVRAAPEDLALVQLFGGGPEVVALGEMSVISHGTEKQGSEPVVGLMVEQFAQDFDTGLNAIRNVFVPRAKVVALSNGGGADAIPYRYKVTSQRSKYRLWGPLLSVSTDGHETTQFDTAMSEGDVDFLAFLGDGATTVFNFPAGMTAISTAKVAVTVDKVLQTSGVTPALDKVTFAAAPATGDVIVIKVEHL